MATGPRDANRVPSLIGKSDSDNTPVVIEADPATKRLKVNTTFTNYPGLVTVPFDEIQATYPTTSTEVYTFKNASLTVATVTVTYTTSAKTVLTSVVRT